jgi:ribosome-associated protein
MLQITRKITIPSEEIEMHAVRSQGAGGQHVNKVATAIHLRFDIKASSLSDIYKQRLLQLRDNRITKEGVIVVKAQQYRTQKKNRDMAIERLRDIIKRVLTARKKRRPTTPTLASVKKRLDNKTRRGRLKELRRKVSVQD